MFGCFPWERGLICLYLFNFSRMRSCVSSLEREMSCFAVMSAWEIEIIVRVCLFLAYFTDLRERGVTFRYFRGRMYLCICVICIRGGVPFLRC